MGEEEIEAAFAVEVAGELKEGGRGDRGDEDVEVVAVVEAERILEGEGELVLDAGRVELGVFGDRGASGRAHRREGIIAAISCHLVTR